MKKLHFLLAALFLICFSGFAQKVKFKKGEVLVDNIVWLKYEGCGTFDGTCSFMNLEGKEIIFMKTIIVEGGTSRTPSNPQGKLVYTQISFLGLDKKIELAETDKKIVQILYKSNVVVNGVLVEENVDILVQKYGTEFSGR
ncbi:hypothetical protein OGH69_09455 [Flavobacterium sp. MFBS3-15]|uniref:hypothetical protein n=1 Tax=Flavobacterium sp. MFBS3-15 TaxID=2989816 RepID=UPI002236490B|nr:hypothetical protein [Flavobacterium sp. MFBS3-15]MCW4469190.1 hypothetical protein [Flavobacterium sp. MFBS3-15]